MAIPYEKIVAEDLQRGIGTTPVTMPAGGTATGTKIGIHTLLPGTYNVRDFGAVGDGLADDTAALQAALDLAIHGQTLIVPPGTYRISQTLRPQSFLRWQGVKGEDLLDIAHSLGGSVLKWSGGGVGPMVWLKDTIGVNIDGINLDGSNTTNLIGYRIDSDNAPTSQRNTIRNFAAWHFGTGASDLAGTAVWLGDSLKSGALTQYQSDGILLENFSIADAHTGIYIDSQNVDYSAIRSFSIGQIRYGIYFNRAGFLQVANGAFGILVGTAAAFLYIEGPHGPLHLVQLQGEQGTGNFLTISNAVSSSAPITIESCVFDQPTDIQGFRKIVSIGNLYDFDFTLSGASVQVVSLGDTFAAGKDFRPTGVNAQVLRFNQDINGHFTIDSTIAGAALELKPSTANAMNPSLRFTNGAQQWDLVFPGAGGYLNGGFVLRDMTGATNPVRVDPGCADDQLRVRPGRTEVNAGLQFTGGVVTDPFAAGTSGVWVRTGVGVALKAAGKNVMVATNTQVQIGPNGADPTLLDGATHTCVVWAEDDSRATDLIIRAAATQQAAVNLLVLRDAGNAAKTWIGPDARLNILVPAFADNAAALAGGLAAGAVYQTAGALKVVF